MSRQSASGIKASAPYISQCQMFIVWSSGDWCPQSRANPRESAPERQSTYGLAISFGDLFIPLFYLTAAMAATIRTEDIRTEVCRTEVVASSWFGRVL
jgi:hypothetical protein